MIVMFIVTFHSICFIKIFITYHFTNLLQNPFSITHHSMGWVQWLNFQNQI